MNMDAYKKLGESLTKCQCPSTNRDRNICGGGGGESMETTELDDIKSWNNLDSVHSRNSSASEQKSWTTMDSIHSRTGGPIGAMMEYGYNSQSHADESNSSFCSFGDSFSNSELGDNITEATAKALAELSIQSRQFCTLSDRPSSSSSSNQPVRRSSLQLKQKYQINTQFRRGSLTLIEESSSLD